MSPPLFQAVGSKLCGVDEAGRGPVIGPMVVVALAADDEEPLVEMGVRDSKRLTRARREELAEQLAASYRYEVIEVPADVLDSVRDDRSLNRLEAELFADAISMIAPLSATVDAADTVEERFGEMVKAHLRRPVPVLSCHYADDLYPVVSAASIIAKVRRDRVLADLSAEFGVEVGSGYCHDPVTVKFLRDWITENRSPPPHCRRSWVTTRRLLGELSLRSLEEFGGS